MSLQWIEAADFHTEAPPPIPWVIESFAAVGAVTVFVGEAGIGKSYTALTMAANVAVGLPVLGMQTKIGEALIVDAENGRQELHRRAVAVGLRANVRVAVVPGGFNLLTQMYELEDACTPATVRLVILDSFRTLFPGVDENSSQEVSDALVPIQRLAREYQVGVILLHHKSKNGTLRGSGAFQAVAEIVVHLAKNNDQAFLYWEKQRMGKRPSKKYVALTEHGAIEV